MFVAVAPAYRSLTFHSDGSPTVWGVATDDLGQRHLAGREDPSVVFRDDVRKLVADAGAQLIEVLPRAQYEWRHLAGAVHIPLSELGERAGELDRTRPVIPYCNDFQ